MCDHSLRFDRYEKRRKKIVEITGVGARAKFPAFTFYCSRLARSQLVPRSHSHMWSTLNFGSLKLANIPPEISHAAQALTRFEELIANDSEVGWQVITYREDARDTVRGPRTHTA